MCVQCMVAYQSIDRKSQEDKRGFLSMKIREVIANMTHSCACTLTASSAALHATMVASMSPVWPTISPFAMLTRTYKMPLSVPALSVHYFFVLQDSSLRWFKFINYQIKFSAQDGIPCLVCNFQGLHLGLNIEGDADVAGNFFIFFQVLVEVSRPISVPEKSDMTKLDCLTEVHMRRRHEQYMVK